VHIFSESARQYYDLERLWRDAERFDIRGPEDSPGRERQSEGGAAAS